MPTGTPHGCPERAGQWGLLDHIEPSSAALAEVRREFGFKAHISLNIQMDGDATPVAVLSVSTMSRLAALDLELDLDLYTHQHSVAS